jgi:hypothetical protein
LKLDFKKVSRAKKSIEIEKEGVSLKGEIYLNKDNLTDFKGKLSNNIKVTCDRCGEEFLLFLDEDIYLKFCDGVFKGFDEEADVIEFFDGKIDFEEVLHSEIESKKLEYHICPKCKGEEDGSSKEA